ncbi:MAG: prepilin-type N-terminal cleavage/methylation domain-containing protein [Bacillota bacterium]|nr:prepilin-type N-terminal cleavage/methylation domain-containing protein [Bacillota bacterium]
MRKARKRIESQRKTEKGFTLIEVIIATLMIGIAVTPLLNLFAASQFHAAKAQQYLTAANLAQAKLEEIKDKAYHEVVSNSGKTPFPNQPAFTYTLSVVPGSRAGTKTVTVTVYWTSLQGEEHLTLTMEKVIR